MISISMQYVSLGDTLVLVKMSILKYLKINCLQEEGGINRNEIRQVEKENKILLQEFTSPSNAE
jgi:hypothetical protein